MSRWEEKARTQRKTPKRTKVRARRHREAQRRRMEAHLIREAQWQDGWEPTR